MPKVSVLMSIYNADRYLSKAIDSILLQSFKDFEFIIIDDGSTDRSLEIVAKYARQDDRIKVVSRKNTGLAVALNEALGLSKGELIARMDADDIALPKRFEKQVDYLNKHQDCVALGCNVLQIDMDGLPICKTDVPLSHGEIEAELLKGNGGAIRHPAVMMRREALLAVGGYREQFKFTEDLDLYLRLGEQRHLANLPDILLEYRLHLSSINFSKYEQQTKESTILLNEAYAKRSLEMPANVLQWRSKQLQPSEHHYLWSKMALKAENFKAARKYAFLALIKQPLSFQTWHLSLRTVKRSIQYFLSLLNINPTTSPH